jgi:hypothetical protein
MTDDVCNHDKVYANHVLTSNPPQYPWICSKCGTTGRDVTFDDNKGPTYDDLNKQFHGGSIATTELKIDTTELRGLSEQEKQDYLNLMKG